MSDFVFLIALDGLSATWNYMYMYSFTMDHIHLYANLIYSLFCKPIYVHMQFWKVLEVYLGQEQNI